MNLPVNVGDFRVHPNAAPLKSKLGDKFILGFGHFRVHPNAAPLKSLCEAQRSTPLTYAVHTLNASSPVEIAAGTLVLFGSSTFGAGVTIDNGAQLDVVQSDPLTLTVSSLNINPGGSLDLADNEMLINFGADADPISTIASYLANGYNGGAWNGPGIVSTTAQIPTNGLLYGLGYADGKDGVVSGLTSGQIEIKYTLLGDANLDGLVNGSDFNILAANFNQSVTGWDQGDFNYDGLVNASDFNELAANFNEAVSGAATAGDVAALDAFAAANGLLADVPEPAPLGLLAMGAAGLLTCRRPRAGVPKSAQN